jgi:hypothetical protein
LPGFSKVMIFASFQGAGKWSRRIQWLNKCIERTRGLLGRCRRHSFGMISKPQAFPNFKDFISFETSQSRTVVSRASTWASTCHLWSQSHKSRTLNWFSKQCWLYRLDKI